MKEIPLAEQLDISRGPIRDALRLLERDGLVEVIPNRGAIVPDVRAVDVLEVYALRPRSARSRCRSCCSRARVPGDGSSARSTACARRSSADARQAADADLAYQSLIIAPPA